MTYEYAFKIALINNNFCTIGIRELLLDFSCKIKAFNSLEQLRKDSFKPSIIILETTDIRGTLQNDIELIRKTKLHMPEVQIIVISFKNNLLKQTQYKKAGAFWVFSVPFSIEDFKTIIAKTIIFCKLLEENKELKNKIETNNTFAFIDTKSANMKTLITKIKTVAPLDIAILLEGDSGTGKTMFAEFIHTQSNRSEGPFVSLSCAALPRELLEAELFGYEKGSFTGAFSKHIGSFEQANGGTLFLDEIGELPFQLQAKLLTVLQDFKIKRLGSTKIKKVDVRIITATNRNLKKMIEEEKFREDLYYRIQIINLKIPPLSERRGDIAMLAINIVNGICKERNISNISISKNAISRLNNYNWPGNVRELKNVLEKATAFCSNGTIREGDLDFVHETDVIEIKRKLPNLSGYSICEIEDRLILDTLESCNGNKPIASEKLGISLKSLYNKLNRLKEVELN